MLEYVTCVCGMFQTVSAAERAREKRDFHSCGGPYLSIVERNNVLQLSCGLVETRRFGHEEEFMGSPGSVHWNCRNDLNLLVS